MYIEEHIKLANAIHRLRLCAVLFWTFSKWLQHRQSQGEYKVLTLVHMKSSPWIFIAWSCK